MSYYKLKIIHRIDLILPGLPTFKRLQPFVAIHRDDTYVLHVSVHLPYKTTHP